MVFRLTEVVAYAVCASLIYTLRRLETPTCVSTRKLPSHHAMKVVLGERIDRPPLGYHMVQSSGVLVCQDDVT